MHLKKIWNLILKGFKMAKSKDNRIDNIEDEIDEIKDELDFLYNLIRPPIPDISVEPDDNYDGPTARIPTDIYNEIVKYCENENCIFMGVA